MSWARAVTRRAVPALALLGACGLLAGTALADSGGNDKYRAGQPPTQDGGEIYRLICQSCHMPDGHGATGAGQYPALAGDPALASADFVAITLLGGRRNMPAFGPDAPGGEFFVLPVLDEAQIAAVVNFVRTSFGNQFTGTISAAQVKALRTPAASKPAAKK